MNIWIMCQGEQRRLAHLDRPKHLLEVNGEPILCRTLRLLRELGTTSVPLVVGRHALKWTSELDAAARGFDGPANHNHATLENPGMCIIDGIHAVIHKVAPSVLDRNTLVLLGDVVWSRAALAQVVREAQALSNGVVFWGTDTLSRSAGEVYAMAWGWEAKVRLIVDIATVPCRVRSVATMQPTRFSQQQGGHLRRLLWWIMERNHAKYVGESRMWDPRWYTVISDWTTDVDADEDVALLPELGRRCAAEVA